MVGTTDTLLIDLEDLLYSITHTHDSFLGRPRASCVDISGAREDHVGKQC